MSNIHQLKTTAKRPSARATDVLGLFGLLLLSSSLLACNGDGASSVDRITDAGGSAAQEFRFLPTPDPDPFYAQPDPMPDVPPGTVLNSRNASFAPLGLPLPNQTWQLQYMSTDIHGRPQAQIATVVQPLLPALDGSKPLLSFHFFTDSAGLQCAPSHVVTGSYDNYLSQAEVPTYLTAALAFGWTLVIPDHGGPSATVAGGPAAGRIALDGVRAAENFEPLGLDGLETPVGMMGFSGGSVPTAWAAAMQADYAPELNIVGAAVGGLIADLINATARSFDGSPLMAAGLAGLLSVNRLYPQLLPPELLTPEGVQLAESLKDSFLVDAILDNVLTSPLSKYSDFMTVDDFYATPGALDVAQKIKLPQANQAPIADFFIYHQRLDELAPIGPVEEVFSAWCDAGSRIHFDRSLGGEHVTGGELFAPIAWLYLQSRFSGAQTATLPPGTETCN